MFLKLFIYLFIYFLNHLSKIPLLVCECLGEAMWAGVGVGVLGRGRHLWCKENPWKRTSSSPGLLTSAHVRKELD